ncbi:ATP phosphoribosyltransferase regulatory subunit, partial [Methylobacterium sp. WL122]
PGPVLVGGGRYDGLLTHLGSATAQPAVGCTFWVDRVAGAGR